MVALRDKMTTFASQLCAVSMVEIIGTFLGDGAAPDLGTIAFSVGWGWLDCKGVRPCGASWAVLYSSSTCSLMDSTVFVNGESTWTV